MAKITWSNVHSAQYTNADGTRIDCVVKFDHLPVEVQFTANAEDVEEHGRLLYAELISGAHGPIAPYAAG